MDDSVRLQELNRKWPHGNWVHAGGPVKGQIYTIRSVTPHYITGEICVKLVELADRVGLRDGGYRIGRFRPLRTQEESVALFAHHLTQAPVSRTVETHNMEPITNDA